MLQSCALVVMEIDSSNVLYLIGGPNGSGKTTLFNKLFCNRPDIKFLNSDELARDLSITPQHAGMLVLDKMNTIFSTHDSFVFETTLAGKFPGKLIRRAHSEGYKVEFLYVILSSVEQNLARVRERVERGGHNVAESIVRRRHDKSLCNFDAIYKLVDDWRLYNNAGAEYCLVASGHEGGDIDIVEPEMYKKFVECKDSIVSKYIADLAARRAARVASNLQIKSH